MTAVPQRVRKLVWLRAGGRCEVGGEAIGDDHSIHHRRPRGMGGTKVPWINGAANLLLLCGSGTTGCHGSIESHRADAYENGWLLRFGQEPAATPVLLFGRGRVCLNDEGDILPC